jgi:hypothetical protein
VDLSVSGAAESTVVFDAPQAPLPGRADLLRAAGGTPFAALPAVLLLGLRNAFYGGPVGAIVRPRGLRRLWTAHFVIDETTGIALAGAVVAIALIPLAPAGVSLPEAVLEHPRVKAAAGRLPIAMLAALIVVELFDSGGRLTADWHALAVAAATRAI